MIKNYFERKNISRNQSDLTFSSKCPSLHNYNNNIYTLERAHLYFTLMHCSGGQGCSGGTPIFLKSTSIFYSDALQWWAVIQWDGTYLLKEHSHILLGCIAVMGSDAVDGHLSF